jgi:hypothetical protein
MWVIIEFNRARDLQSNHGIVATYEGLVNFVNEILLSQTYKNSKLVMIPPNTSHLPKKIFPLITSHKNDFYAQWFEDPIN